MKFLGALFAFLALVFAVVSGMSHAGVASLQANEPAGCHGGPPGGGPPGPPPPPPPANATG